MEDLLKVSEVQLIYRSKVPAKERMTVKTSLGVNALFHSTWDKDNIGFIEKFKVLYLNRANKALCISEISSGGTTGTVIDVKIILTTALKVVASSIILCHNHPSGNTQPSESDIEITNKIIGACKLVDLKVLDHIIITPDNGYFSFADEGLI